MPIPLALCSATDDMFMSFHLCSIHSDTEKVVVPASRKRLNCDFFL